MAKCTISQIAIYEFKTQITLMILKRQKEFNICIHQSYQWSLYLNSRERDPFSFVFLPNLKSALFSHSLLCDYWHDIFFISKSYNILSSKSIKIKAYICLEIFGESGLKIDWVVSPSLLFSIVDSFCSDLFFTTLWSRNKTSVKLTL